ncbi:MAG: DUF1249 domain-containing protein [Sinobacterium sp.]|nr:DUF1249 domain-containing protein [Sinobacterium sp.]
MPAIDLTRYLSECELNYLRLMRLSPVDLTNKEEESSFLQFALENAQTQYAQLSMNITRQAPYTTMLSLCCTFMGSPMFLSQALQGISVLEFDVRLYHDAHVLEIMGFQGDYCIQPSYVYPNKRMHQTDEKLQQQILLRLCLQCALKDALAIESPWQP